MRTNPPHNDFAARGDLVFGYPETEPSEHHFGSMPKGSGARATIATKADKKTTLAVTKTAIANRPPATAGPPLPKRPKGRLFISTVILCLIGFVFFTIYDQTIRYVAYGEITAKTISVAAPWPGVITSVTKRDGDSVQAGEIIAGIDSTEIQLKIDAIEDSLRVERAQLASEFETIRWQAQQIKDSRRLSQSEFYDKYSDLLWQQSRLSDLRSQQKRLRLLVADGVASQERLATLAYQVAGQEKRIEKLKQAVESLKDRGDHDLELSLEDRVRPTLVRIENLQSELDRNRQLRAKGEVRAKIGGKIIRMNRFVGEFTNPDQPVAEMLVHNSESAVIYIEQDLASQYRVGTIVSLYCPSLDGDLRCEVIRADLQMQTPPDSLARYYAVDQNLLPVHLNILDASAIDEGLPIGSELRLARKNPTGILLRLKQIMLGWINMATK